MESMAPLLEPRLCMWAGQAGSCRLLLRRLQLSTGTFPAPGSLVDMPLTYPPLLCTLFILSLSFLTS